jgi:hypothetical protein
MRKIDLTPYDVPLYEKGEIIGKTPYKVRESLANLAFVSGDRPYEGRELLKREVLAVAIETAGDSILLEEADWQKLVKAVDVIPKTRNEVGLVRRLLEAPEVKVDEVKHG